MTDISSDARPAERPPDVTLSALFFGFLYVGLSGFGGVLPWARRMIVDQRRWLTEREFTDLVGLCQFLPGPNIINVSVALGGRFRGIPGAIASFSGLVFAPLGLMVTVAALYKELGHIDAVRGLLVGIAAVAAGQVIAMGVKMAAAWRKDARALIFIAIAFTAVAVLRWPLIWVLATLLPLSVVVAYAWTRRG